MKRSAETCAKISQAALGRKAYNKGLKAFYDPITLMIKRFYDEAEAPSGWLRGDPTLKGKKKKT